MEHLVGRKVKERFFDFMQVISLPTNHPKKKKLLSEIKNFESSLNLPQYKSLSEFIGSQSSEYK